MEKRKRGKKVTVVCDACGKEFTKPPSLVKSRNYCNRECKAKGNSMLFDQEPERRKLAAQKTKEQLATKGHPSIGRHHNAETKIKISEKRKAFYQTEEGKEARTKISEQRRASAGNYHHSDETIEKIRAKKLERDKDPSYQDKINDSLEEKRKDPEYHKNLSEGVKRFHASPEGHEVAKRKSIKMRLIKKSFYKTPEGKLVRGKLSSLMSDKIVSGEIKPNSHGHFGIRADLNEVFRSNLEANYARILKYKGTSYEYENTTFKLSTGQTYTPDFYLPDTDEYVELKGYYKAGERLKYDMFKKEYPNVKWRIILQTSQEWEDLRSKYKPLIPLWEGVK